MEYNVTQNRNKGIVNNKIGHALTYSFLVTQILGFDNKYVLWLFFYSRKLKDKGS